MMSGPACEANILQFWLGIESRRLNEEVAREMSSKAHVLLCILGLGNDILSLLFSAIAGNEKD